MRKVICLFSAIGVVLSMQSLCAQAVTPAELNLDKTPELSEIEKEFTNLPEQKRIDYNKHFQEANRLYQQHRIFETLAQIHDARKIFDKNAALFNLLGQCYVEFRDFPRAKEFYLKASALAPDSAPILFNLAELEFVTHKWESCLTQMNNVLSLLPKDEVALRRLVELRILLCNIAMGNNNEAEALANKYDPLLDDSPFYYYAQACLAFRDKDPDKAQSFLLMALRVFRNPAILAHWDDSLIEFGYIKSFFGGTPGEEE